MSSNGRTMVLVLGGAALGCLAAAQDAVGAASGAATLADPVLEGLVAEALGANPDLLALQEAVLAADARPEQARSLRDPMLSMVYTCLLYTSPSPRDTERSRMPSSA